MKLILQEALHFIILQPLSFLLLQDRKVSLYFHIPLCKRKCPYCHFYVTRNSREARLELLEALSLELERIRPHLVGKEVISVYLGGGTPFLLPAEEVAHLLEGIPLADGCEITIEANPEDVSLEKVEALRWVGVNRLSLGVQSFDNGLLKRLGRGHTAELATLAIFEARAGGMENLSIDLMFDIPTQDLRSWEATLAQVERVPITHLSLYNLTIEPKTAFARRKEELKLLLPSEIDGVKMWDRGVAVLEQMGLNRYEVSAFTRPGYASRHNVGYWTGRPFLGLGPSAFSYWKGRRFRNVASLKRYASALIDGISPVDFEETLGFPDHLHELLVVALRLVVGVNLAAFEQKYGALPQATHERLKSLQNEGFMTLQGTQAALTKQGFLFYDTVAETLI